MNQATGTGKIVTFYSFKGGVGRTMAVANLAFLAALNGRRVLLMDWDLEAPGLAYYFRGMRDAADILAIDSTPGVLDILCQWGADLDKAESEEEIDSLQQRMESGEPFQNCVQSLVQADVATALLPSTACLDIIGSGARNIAALNNLPYEEALAQFSWGDFFEQKAGGFVLEKMRMWAKNHYDFIFIDSRTGLADIAGICTMQLPDIVALCFALNQQNIEGIARIAAAIHAKRGQEVTLRAVPMRVAQRDSAQESEAQARAASALARVGGFSKASIKADMEELSIPLVDHLPFYETLAAFVAKDPALDQLTLSYLRLGKKLLDPALGIPEFNQGMIAEIKQRLQPRIATVEYVNGLKTAEPEMAYAELQKLVESALAIVANGESLEEDYLITLLDVTLHVIARSYDPDESIVLAYKVLDIIRELNFRAPGGWLNTLRFAIERVLDESIFTAHKKDEVALWYELDDILALIPGLAISFKRIQNLRKAAWLCVEAEIEPELVKAIAQIKEVRHGVHQISPTLSPEDRRVLLAVDVDTHFLEGQLDLLHHDGSAAQQEFEAALVLLTDLDLALANSELGRLRFRLHYTLATLPGVAELVAAKHAIGATEWGGIFFRHYFMQLAQVVLRTDHPETILDFCAAFFVSMEKFQPALVRYFAGSNSSTLGFLEINTEFIKVLQGHADVRANEILSELIQIIVDVLVTGLRHSGGRFHHAILSNRFESVISELITILEDMPLAIDYLPTLLEVRTAAMSPQATFNPPTDSQ